MIEIYSNCKLINNYIFDTYKDGIWAILAWLSILADRNETTEEGELIGVQDIVE